ncbi:MAG: LEA type 2 family protein [Thermoanaerobaculia bacterium]
MRIPAAALLALLVPLSAGAVPAKGTVRAVEVTSMTREKAFLFVRTTLPAVARGAKQTFRGDASAWGVPLGLKAPVSVLVQPAGAAWDAVFLVDLDLAALPKALLDRGSPASVPVTLKGTLSGEAGSAATVDAAGTLRPGTAELVARREQGQPFVRFAGARLSGLGLAESTGEARIAVYNPFRFELALRGLRYELSSGETVVARGSRQGILVRPGRENEVVLPLAVGNAAAISAAGKAVAAGGKISGELKGEIVLKLGTGDVKLPLAGSGTIEVLK